MKENSIEETIKHLKLILKIRKEQKEIIECAGGSCINCNPDIEALNNSIEILSDYKRTLKENEELKEYKKNRELTKISCCTAQNCEALNNAIKEGLKNQRLQKENEELKIINDRYPIQLSDNQFKTTIKLAQNDINQQWIQKVKDKIEELEKAYEDSKDENGESEYYYPDYAINILQELIEESEEK